MVLRRTGATLSIQPMSTTVSIEKVYHQAAFGFTLNVCFPGNIVPSRRDCGKIVAAIIKDYKWDGIEVVGRHRNQAAFASIRGHLGIPLDKRAWRGTFWPVRGHWRNRLIRGNRVPKDIRLP